MALKDSNLTPSLVVPGLPFRPTGVLSLSKPLLNSLAPQPHSVFQENKNQRHVHAVKTMGLMNTWGCYE